MRGFHLLELLIVLAMISILTAISLPIYSQYLAQEKRLAAASALTKLRLALEQYHIEHNTYRGATLTALHVVAPTGKNPYQLRIQSATANDYLLSAEPAVPDIQCGALTLAANGERGITGVGKVEECW